jgi:hypothetical protein
LLPDDRFNAVPDLLEDVRLAHAALHDELPLKEHPLMIYAASYQDGLMDALGRIPRMQHTGSYSHRHDVERILRQYEEWRRDTLRRRKYWHLSYIEGYQSGLLFLLLDDKDREAVPLYFAFGAGDKEFTAATRKAM